MPSRHRARPAGDGSCGEPAWSSTTPVPRWSARNSATSIICSGYSCRSKARSARTQRREAGAPRRVAHEVARRERGRRVLVEPGQDLAHAAEGSVARVAVQRLAEPLRGEIGEPDDRVRPGPWRRTPTAPTRSRRPGRPRRRPARAPSRRARAPRSRPRTRPTRSRAGSGSGRRRASARRRRAASRSRGPGRCARGSRGGGGRRSAARVRRLGGRSGPPGAGGAKASESAAPRPHRGATRPAHPGADAAASRYRSHSSTSPTDGRGR